MAGNRLPHLQRYGSTMALLAEMTHLTWEHFHGGVLRHHILNRADLPAVSNWWGILLLPGLAWYLLGRINKRSVSLADQGTGRLPNSVKVGFAAALLFGISLAAAFANGYPTLCEYLFKSILLLALLLPVYRAECMLGFVLGMTFVFGVVLPTAIAGILAGFSMLIHRVLRPALGALWMRLRRKRPASA